MNSKFKNRMDIKQKSQLIKEIGYQIGFDKIGIARAGLAPKAEFLEKWLANGKHGTMTWMEKHKEIRKDLRQFFPEARSVIMVALNYYTPHPIKTIPQTAKISRYAWGSDYHKILKKMLKRFLEKLQSIDPTIRGRAFVDSAPVMEKQWAVQAGLGWQGKNTNLITRDLGSWLFLGGLAINQELVYDHPTQDYCGNCDACVTACPTNALEPYVLDPTKCISYLTIEYRGTELPTTLKDKLENWVFGCDICQDVCPWNRFAKKNREPRFNPKDPKMVNPPLNFLAQLKEDEFDSFFAGTPVRRAKYHNFMQNLMAIIDQQTKQQDKQVKNTPVVHGKD